MWKKDLLSYWVTGFAYLLFLGNWKTEKILWLFYCTGQCWFAGCNTSGYAPLDGQDVFTTEFAETTGFKTYGSQGKTGPLTTRGYSGLVRHAVTRWVLTEADGTRKKAGTAVNEKNITGSVINIAHPEQPIDTETKK